MSYYSQKTASGEGLIENPQPFGSIYVDGAQLVSTNSGTDNQVLIAHTNAPPSFGDITPGIITGVVTLAQGGTGVNNTAVSGFFAGPSGSTGSASFRSIVSGDLPVIQVAQGGTGLTSVTNGSVLGSNGSGGVASIVGTAGQVLTSNGAAAPTFQPVSGLISGLTTSWPVLASSATTIATPDQHLGVINGGTGLSTTTAHYAFLGPLSGPGGAPGFRPIFASDLPSLPFSQITGTVPIAQGGTNLTSVTLGGVLASNGAGGLAYVTGSSGQVLTSNGAGAPTFQAVSGLISGLTTGNAVFASSSTSLYTPTTAVDNFQMLPNGQGLVIQQTAQRAYTFVTAMSSGYSAGALYSNASSGANAWFGLDGIGGVGGASGSAYIWSQAGADHVDFYYGVSPILMGRFSSIGLSNIADIAITNTKSANTVWAGPTTGSAVPSFRALVAADIPSLPFSQITGTVPIAQGGTNLTSITNGGVLVSDGSGGLTSVVGTSGQVLTSNGAAAPSFQPISGVISGLTTGYPVVAASSTSISTPNAQLQISQGGTGTATTLQSYAFIGPQASSGAPTFRALVAGDIPTIPLTQTSGTLAINRGGTGLTSTSQNFTFVGPTSGSGAPSFRLLVAGDIPSLPFTQITGIVPIAQGGTGTATTLQSYAFIGPQASSGAPTFRALVAGDLPTIPLTQTSGTLAINRGGTGLTSTSQNFVFAGPTSGAGAPTWRVLVAGDIPSLPFTQITGTVPISQGGTGAATFANSAVLIGPTSGGPLAPTVRTLVLGDLPAAVVSQTANMTTSLVPFANGNSTVFTPTLGTNNYELARESGGALRWLVNGSAKFFNVNNIGSSTFYLAGNGSTGLTFGLDGSGWINTNNNQPKFNASDPNQLMYFTGGDTAGTETTFFTASRNGLSTDNSNFFKYATGSYSSAFIFCSPNSRTITSGGACSADYVIVGKMIIFNLTCFNTISPGLATNVFVGGLPSCDILTLAAVSLPYSNLGGLTNPCLLSFFGTGTSSLFTGTPPSGGFTGTQAALGSYSGGLGGHTQFAPQVASNTDCVFSCTMQYYTA